jgi:hypothetical protein
MEILAFCYPTVAVSLIYCIWAAYLHVRRGRILRDRVTFMLWTMANQPRHGGNLPRLPATTSRPARVSDKWSAVGAFSFEMAPGNHPSARVPSWNNHGTLIY